MIASLK